MNCLHCKTEEEHQMKISQETFKRDFGGDLSNLQNKLAVMPSEASKPRKKYEYAEFKLQAQVAKYLEFQYPDVLFISNPINLNLSDAQRKMNGAIQKRDFKCPDMIIFQRRHGHNGLLLELKKDSPLKKDGNLKKNAHLEGQMKAIQELHKRGYYAGMFWSFDEVKKVIDWYLG